MKYPTVVEMVRAHLKTHGYDGLYCDDCGCEISDLNPCGEMGIDCQAGYKRGEGINFRIGPFSPPGGTMQDRLKEAEINLEQGAFTEDEARWLISEVKRLREAFESVSDYNDALEEEIVELREVLTQKALGE